MSKERLEDIENMIDAFDESLFISLYGYELDAPTVVDDFKYLIERVQELEHDCEYLSYYYGLDAEQNEIYKEALEHIKEHSDCKVSVFIARRALERVLEGVE